MTAASGFRTGLALAVGLVATLAVTPAAHAFCGFYINGAGGEMFNNATQVVLMRSGTRTVLSMQNNYQGPPQDFALVVPVPIVLKEADVKTLTKGVFTKVDAMGAPRLVDYWEQDPCSRRRSYDDDVDLESADEGESDEEEKPRKRQRDYGVTIEAKFTVGEYDIVILSAKESTGLDRYLRDQKYQIPKGAEPLLRPYVEGGSKFFVAKVDPKKVRFENGQAMLSPLRFHYDSEEFSLPIRLGLANARDKQDLIVNILAPGQRYDVANYKNITIPTNLNVKDGVRARFGEFYAALFDSTLEKHPGAVVTEYAWDASSCDPCPGPTLNRTDFTVLGADVLGPQGSGRGGFGFVLTRLHARYGADGAPNDLIFKAAPPIAGGREVRAESGQLEQGANPDSINNFQGRYAIRHAWTGPIPCANPVRGRWGGPLDDDVEEPPTQPATNLAFAPRGQIPLPSFLAEDVAELDVKAGGPPLPSGGGFQTKAKGCGCATGDLGGLAGGALLAGLSMFALRRRRKQ